MASACGRSFSTDFVERPRVDDVRDGDRRGLVVTFRAHLTLKSGGRGGRHRQEVGRPDVGRVAKVGRVPDHGSIDAWSSGKYKNRLDQFFPEFYNSTIIDDRFLDGSRIDSS